MRNSFLKRSAYTVLDWLTFGKGVVRKINGMKVRFPARWSRYYESDYESGNYNFLKEQVKPGMHIIDVGAHLGLFSSVSAQLTGPEGKIVCFEPTPGTFKLLQQTLKLNHCSNVTAVQAAISKKEGSATFYVGNTDANNSNSLVKNKAESEISGYEVKLTTIDKAVQQYQLSPSLIKIDAEGAEMDALRGAVRTIKDHMPMLILGLHPAAIVANGDSLKEIWDLVKEANYKIFYNNTEIRENEFTTQKDLFDVHVFPSDSQVIKG